MSNKTDTRFAGEAHAEPTIAEVLGTLHELGEAVVAGDRQRYRDAYVVARKQRLTNEQIHDAWSFPLRKNAVTWPTFDWRGEERASSKRAGGPSAAQAVFVIETNGDRLAICSWCGWISGRLPVGATTPNCPQCGGNEAA